MFIGHLPAGYLASSALSRTFPTASRKRLLAIGLACSVLPDLDLLYFYTLGAQQHPHHTYWPHLPALWFVVFGLSAPLAVHIPQCRPYILVASVNVLLHLVLDSVAAEILWLHPLSSEGFGLVEVPARHSWWVLNFLGHWTFGLELSLVGAAAAVALAPRLQPLDRPRRLRPAP